MQSTFVLDRVVHPGPELDSVGTPSVRHSEISAVRCPWCQRPFGESSQRDRHALRCKNRDRSRKRACLPCSRAKARCDQQTPACNRCLLKGLSCAYAHAQEHSAHRARERAQQPDFPAGDVADRLSTAQSTMRGQPVETPPTEFDFWVVGRHAGAPVTPLSESRVPPAEECMDEEILASILL
ncbi:hypothetical protein VTO42DRAFT_2341 [Malbranchea cinnamomea]